MDSDSDYSGDDQATRTRVAKGKGKEKAGSKQKPKSKPKTIQPYTWEESFARSWDTVQEDDTGSLTSAVEDWLARGRRRRIQGPDGAIRRSIIRHLILLIDLSVSMMDRDMRPNRWDLSLQYAREFIIEWFDQNPLGQIGIVGMRAGLGERICEMSGSIQDVLKSISEKHKLEPAGEPSLQNAVEMARNAMSHLPTHSSREILIIFGSLTTCDPGNIHDTLDDCVKSKIRISVVALAAEMKICRDLCEKTGGQFGVAMNEGHFKDLLFELVPPPAQRAVARPGTSTPSGTPPAAPSTINPSADLMLMGFPTRLPHSSPAALCVCHSQLKSEGFLCPRCLAKVCDVPTDCDICGLMIVSSPHLARSYHHLFPVKAFDAIRSIDDDMEPALVCCGCEHSFPIPNASQTQKQGSVLTHSSSTTDAPAAGPNDPAPAAVNKTTSNGNSNSPAVVGGASKRTKTTAQEDLSPLGRYRCPTCKNDFCSDCDIFIHEVVHCCPGCGK